MDTIASFYILQPDHLQCILRNLGELGHLIHLGGTIEYLPVLGNLNNGLCNRQRSLVVAVGHQFVKEDGKVILTPAFQHLQKSHSHCKQQLHPRTTGELGKGEASSQGGIHSIEGAVAHTKGKAVCRNTQQPITRMADHLRHMNRFRLLLHLLKEGVHHALVHFLSSLGLQSLLGRLVAEQGFLQLGIRAQRIIPLPLSPVLFTQLLQLPEFGLCIGDHIHDFVQRGACSKLNDLRRIGIE